MAKPPHLPPLHPDFELEPPPKRKRGEWFKPVNGIQYKVQDGDNLADLALKGGMSSDALLEYAFGTTVPREVNWYLNNRVGCKFYSADVENE